MQKERKVMLNKEIKEAIMFFIVVIVIMAPTFGYIFNKELIGFQKKLIKIAKENKRNIAIRIIAHILGISLSALLFLILAWYFYNIDQKEIYERNTKKDRRK